jgi:CheY-like chemotaxis protein
MPSTNTILLVDDDPDCRSLFRDAAAEAGVTADVREAVGGTEALNYLRRRGRHAGAPRPALVLLDIELPGLSGHDVLHHMMADPVLRGVPVVMLTSLDDDERRRRALREGAVDYVVKPIAPSTLARLADEWLPNGSAPPGRPHARDNLRQGNHDTGKGMSADPHH